MWIIFPTIILFPGFFNVWNITKSWNLNEFITDQPVIEVYLVIYQTIPMKNLTCSRLEIMLKPPVIFDTSPGVPVVNQASKVQKNGRQQRLASPQVLALDSGDESCRPRGSYGTETAMASCRKMAMVISYNWLFLWDKKTFYKLSGVIYLLVLITFINWAITLGKPCKKRLAQKIIYRKLLNFPLCGCFVGSYFGIFVFSANNTHRIHGAGIYANIGGILMVHVTIYLGKL